MKLYYSTTSPYVRKVHVAAIEKGLDRRIERVIANPWSDPAALVGSSDKAMRELRWAPRFAQLDTIVETAWRCSTGPPRLVSGSNTPFTRRAKCVTEVEPQPPIGVSWHAAQLGWLKAGPRPCACVSGRV